MAKMERMDNKALGSLFSGNKINLKRSMTVLSTGTSIFYDNLIAEEAKEKYRQMKRMQGKKDTKIKEVTKNKEDEQITVIKRNSVVRLSWTESEPVIKSGILEKITAYERTLHEAKFEIITTEITYLNGLNELITRFLENDELHAICTKDQWQTLFGNITMVKAASELVLSDLMQHWQEDITLTNIYTVLRQHAISVLRVCKEYCRKQPNAQKVLTTLNEDEPWRSTLIKIENDHIPRNSLQSYLALPMQRVTRLPLLLEAVASRLQQGTNEFTACKLAISAMKKLANDCNDSVGKEKESTTLQLINKELGKGKPGTKSRPSSWTSTTSWHV